MYVDIWRKGGEWQRVRAEKPSNLLRHFADNIKDCFVDCNNIGVYYCYNCRLEIL